MTPSVFWGSIGSTIAHWLSTQINRLINMLMQLVLGGIKRGMLGLRALAYSTTAFDALARSHPYTSSIRSMAAIKHPNVPRITKVATECGTNQRFAQFEEMKCNLEDLLKSKVLQPQLYHYYYLNGLRDAEPTLVAPLGLSLIRNISQAVLVYNIKGLRVNVFKRRCLVNYELLNGSDGVKRITSIVAKLFRSGWSRNSLLVSLNDAKNLHNYLKLMVKDMGVDGAEIEHAFGCFTSPRMEPSEYLKLIDSAFFTEIHRRHTFICQLFEHLQERKPASSGEQLIDASILNLPDWRSKIDAPTMTYLHGEKNYKATSAYWLTKCIRTCCQHRENINAQATTNNTPVVLGDSVLNVILYFHKACPSYFFRAVVFYEDKKLQFKY